MKNQLIRVAINLSKIPQNRIKKSGKSGDLYFDIVITGRKEPDQFGNDVTVYMNQTEEEQKAKADKQYVGQGKNYVFTEDNAASNLVQASPEDLAFLGQVASETPTSAGEDLPF